MSEFDDIFKSEDLIKAREGGCVSLAKLGNEYFFSYNGIKFSKEDHRNIRDIIKNILPYRDVHFVGARYAFSLFDPDCCNIKCMEMHEISFYTKLNKQNNNILFFDRCIVQPIRYKKGKYKAINNRFFTCAEKKLYLKLVSPEFVYTTRRPCYHCLPVIKSQYYFDGGSIYNINCIPEINKADNRVVYKYTRKSV